jgi:hypothetical protein
MHLGNVFSALLSWLSAKSKGGKWLLRIEDIDPQRSKQQYADQIMRDLEWLGLTWDEGPYYQSERGEIYEEYLERLRRQNLLYLSYKTRAERLAVSAPQEDSPIDSPLTNSPLIPSFPEGQKLLERGEQLQSSASKSVNAYSSPLFKRGAGGESLSTKEIDLIQKISEYGDAVAQAGKDYSPSGIANYCYELTKAFNQFYHDFSILNAETEEQKQVRLCIAANVAKTIKNGMALLGIEVPERM